MNFSMMVEIAVLRIQKRHATFPPTEKQYTALFGLRGGVNSFMNEMFFVTSIKEYILALAYGTLEEEELSRCKERAYKMYFIYSFPSKVSHSER